jgi:hypothetical protein
MNFPYQPEQLTVEWLTDTLRQAGVLNGANVISFDEVIKGLSAYAAAGVEEVMVQWFGVADIEGLATLADQVLPHFRS